MKTKEQIEAEITGFKGDHYKGWDKALKWVLEDD